MNGRQPSITLGNKENEKSQYLCNRFREGEPLKMTDWKI